MELVQEKKMRGELEIICTDKSLKNFAIKGRREIGHLGRPWIGKTETKAMSQ